MVVDNNGALKDPSAKASSSESGPESANPVPAPSTSSGVHVLSSHNAPQLPPPTAAKPAQLAAESSSAAVMKKPLSEHKPQPAPAKVVATLGKENAHL